MKNLKLMIQAIAGLLLALLVIWGVGAVVLVSPTLYEYYPKIGIALRASDSYKQQRGEGWVHSSYGKMGFEKSELSKLDSSKPKCLILGDSYIEAVMIPGKNRMQNQIISEKYDVLGVGFSGVSAIEYAYLIKHFPKIMNNIAYYIVFIGDVSDIKNIDASLCDGMHKGGLPVRSSSRLDKISYSFRLYAFRALLRRWKRYKPDILGNHWRYNNKEIYHDRSSDIRSVCKALKTLTGSHPLLIVYAPNIPHIYKNQLVFSDSESDFARQLETACLENQIGFLNMQSIFCQNYKTNGRFVSGFFNTPPGEGHLNSLGHKLVAEAITHYLAGE